MGSLVWCFRPICGKKGTNENLKKLPESFKIDQVCRSAGNELFVAGRLKDFLHEWENLTADPKILDIVSHCHIEFDKNVPRQSFFQGSKFSETEEKIIDCEIEKLQKMQVIKEVSFDRNQIISPIFTRPKKNGEYRMILNLKLLNLFVAYHHFKMDTFESAVKLIKENCYLASIDLRHAYYSIPIAEEHQILLRFRWRGKHFQYTCLPNGIACAPRFFTKLLKPVYATLRCMGHTSVAYIDDSLLIADTATECRANVTATITLMEKLGFIVHDKKSVVVPSQEITFLGNIINSNTMTVHLSPDRITNIFQACKTMATKNLAKIREVARVIGLLVASFSAIECGKLFYRKLELAKIQALRISHGKFEGSIQISEEMKQDLSWWVENVPNQKRIINRGNPDITLVSDASTLGWGGVCGQVKIGGRWNDYEVEFHINYLELLAAFLTLKAFCRDKHSIHVKILMDNTSAIAYINNMGGIRSKTLNDLARECWLWCLERDIWISAYYLPGVENEADTYSRNFNDQIEWKLDESIFIKISEIFGEPDIDLFATRLNKQIPKYVAWKPDPGALFIDAFSGDWHEYYCYAFPPFSLISRVLQKVHSDGCDCLIIVPLWPTQIWFTALLEMVTHCPIILPRSPHLLRLPTHVQRTHPLHGKLTLIACRLSGQHYKSVEFRRNLPTSLWRPGEEELKNNMRHTSKDGFLTVIKNKLIQFRLL